MTPREMEELARAWRTRALLRDFLLALAAAAFTATLLLPWAASLIWVAVLVFGATRLIATGSRRYDAAEFVLHLNRTHPELEESSALWLRSPETLTLLERLQRRRLDFARARHVADNPRWRPSAPAVDALRPAVHLAGVSLFCLVVTAIGVAFARAERRRETTVASASLSKAGSLGSNKDKKVAPPQIIRAELSVFPPEYTGKPARQIAGFNAETEEGALVRWRVTLNRPVRNLRLVFNQENGKTLAFQSTASAEYNAGQAATDSCLYHLAGTLTDGTAWNPPEVYALKVLKDSPPTIRFVRPADTRTEIDPSMPRENAALAVPIEVIASDDYAVASAGIVATVAKGSGEAVKFREARIAFDLQPGDAPLTLNSTRHFTKMLDLAALGMEPGDELYFHVEAADNRQPAPNHARSETRFVLLKGPAAKALSTGQGVAGVNLVPQYFRSERQIIIDTEKLIADQPAISREEFVQRANDLGIDQQLLRLRYGQFLGEELEQGQGAGDQPEPGTDARENGVPKDMVHQHDAAPDGSGSANLQLGLIHDAEHSAPHNDDHAPAAPATDTGRPLSAGEVIAPFVDEHDSQDTATLFDHEQKSTMRNALAAMWEAEKFLRTNRPKEALVPANRALAILKDIQQSARAYVQHVGFEPAPLKLDRRRLQGSVIDVRERANADVTTPSGDPALSAIRDAIREIPWHAGLRDLPVEILDALRRAEPALTAAATRQPDVYLAPLQTLRKVTTQGQPVNESEAADLERALLHLLPSALTQPTRRTDLSPESARYFQALDAPEKP